MRDADAVAAWLDLQRYWKTHAERSSPWQQPEYRRHRIDELGATFAQHLDSDAWLARFPGKEVLRHLRTHVPGLDRTPPRSASSPVTRDTDLAKRITRKMREDARIPEPLLSLHDELRRRAGHPT